MSGGILVSRRRTPVGVLVLGATASVMEARALRVASSVYEGGI